MDRSDLGQALALVGAINSALLGLDPSIIPHRSPTSKTLFQSCSMISVGTSLILFAFPTHWATLLAALTAYVVTTAPVWTTADRFYCEVLLGVLVRASGFRELGLWYLSVLAGRTILSWAPWLPVGPAGNTGAAWKQSLIWRPFPTPVGIGFWRSLSRHASSTSIMVLGISFWVVLIPTLAAVHPVWTYVLGILPFVTAVIGSWNLPFGHVVESALLMYVATVWRLAHPSFSALIPAASALFVGSFTPTGMALFSTSFAVTRWGLLAIQSAPSLRLLLQYQVLVDGSWETRTSAGPTLAPRWLRWAPRRELFVWTGSMGLDDIRAQPLGLHIISDHLSKLLQSNPTATSARVIRWVVLPTSSRRVVEVGREWHSVSLGTMWRTQSADDERMRWQSFSERLKEENGGLLPLVGTVLQQHLWPSKNRPPPTGASPMVMLGMWMDQQRFIACWLQTPGVDAVHRFFQSWLIPAGSKVWKGNTPEPAESCIPYLLSALVTKANFAYSTPEARREAAAIAIVITELTAESHHCEDPWKVFGALVWAAAGASSPDAAWLRFVTGGAEVMLKGRSKLDCVGAVVWGVLNWEDVQRWLPVGQLMVQSNWALKDSYRWLIKVGPYIGVKNSPVAPRDLGVSSQGPLVVPKGRGRWRVVLPWSRGRSHRAITASRGNLSDHDSAPEVDDMTTTSSSASSSDYKASVFTSDSESD